MVPAPDLREVAETWWDVDRDPAVVWDEGATTFALVDPRGDPADRLELARFDAPVADPARVATALASGLAACDFPPTGHGLAPGRAALTLRIAGVTDVPTDPPPD